MYECVRECACVCSRKIMDGIGSLDVEFKNQSK